MEVPPVCRDLRESGTALPPGLDRLLVEHGGYWVNRFGKQLLGWNLDCASRAALPLATPGITKGGVFCELRPFLCAASVCCANANNWGGTLRAVQLGWHAQSRRRRAWRTCDSATPFVPQGVPHTSRASSDFQRVPGIPRRTIASRLVWLELLPSESRAVFPWPISRIVG